MKQRTYLNVPYADRTEAKRLGAKWDKFNRSWYIEGRTTDGFGKWLRPCEDVTAQCKADIEKALTYVPAAERMKGVVPRKL